MIQISNISKTYNPKKGRSVEALKNIELTIDAKGMVFLLGKSGSGKSTLLNIIGGLDGYDQGDVKIFGKSTKYFSEQLFDDYRNTFIGFIFQEYNLIETYSVYKNIALALELQGKKVSKDDVLQVLKQVELEEEIDRMPHELSGGQKQRVSIARALIKNPDIILADEPTGSLDSDTSKQIFELLKNLSQDKLILIVSHDREYANTYGNRVIELSDGKVISDSNPIETESSKDGNHLNMIKAKLPFIDALKLALTSIKIKPTRLVFTILLSLFAFTLFGLVDTVASYDNTETIVRSSHKNGDTQIPLVKQIYDPLNMRYADANNSIEDLSTLKQNYPDRKFFPVIDKFKAIQGTVFNSPAGSDEYYGNHFGGYLEISEDFIDTFDFDLIGELPKNDMEVVIPYYIYEYFEAFEYRENGLKVLIDRPEDLLGRKLSSDEDFVIVGVLDTKFDSTKFQPLHDTSGDRYHTYRQLINASKKIKEGSVHTYLYVNTGYYENNIYRDTITDFYFNYIDIIKTTDLTDYKQMNEGSTVAEPNWFRVITALPEDSMLKEATKTMINDDEILIGYDSITEWYFFENTHYEDYIYDKTIELITEFAQENFNEIKADFEHMMGEYPEKTFQDYVTYIYNQDEYNKFQPEYTKNYFENVANRTYINEFLLDELDLLGLRLQIEDSRYTGFKFAGFYEGNDILVTQAGLNNLIEEGSYYDFKQVVISMSKNVDKDIAMMKSIEKEDVKFHFDNDIAYVLIYANNTLTFYSWFALGASFIFAIFAALLFYNFMSTSINHKKKDIGILRAIGATKRDVYKIFFSEAAIIAMIIFIFSLVVDVIAVNAANNFISKIYFMHVALLNFGIRQILLLLLLGLFIAGLASGIPVYKFSKQKPIDVIKLI